MNLLKSIGAILVGVVVGSALSVATDSILLRAGLMQLPFDENATVFILFVVGYRFVYQTASAFIIASLAPNRPMRHVIISGWLGVAVATAGAIIMRDEGPRWYAIVLIATALPSAWLGGKLRGAIGGT